MCIEVAVDKARANETRLFLDNLFLKVPEKYGFTRHFGSAYEGEKLVDKIFYKAPCGKKLFDNEDLETFFINSQMSPYDLIYTNFNFKDRVIRV